MKDFRKQTALESTYHSSLGWRIKNSTIALPLTPLQPVTKATFGEESGDMFDMVVLMLEEACQKAYDS